MANISQTLIARAQALAAEVAERGREIDRDSKLPDDLVRKFVDLELVATLTPKRFGGHECDLQTAIEIIRIVAEADLAVAWVLAFYIGHNWIHCQFPEQAQQEIFASGPSPCSAGVLAPNLKLRAVDGGYRVSGRNGWNSGSPHAQWILGSGMVVEGDASKGPLCFIVPRDEVVLVDTWDVQGMRATGSWDAVYEDIFVPSHRVVEALAFMSGKTPGSVLHDNPLYTRPLILVTFVYSLAPFVGALRGVADECLRITKARVGKVVDKKPAVEKPTAYMRAGRGHANSQIAEALLNDMTALSASAEGSQLGIEGRLNFKARSAALVGFCTEAVNDLVLGSGASAFRTDSRLQAVYRNINMIGVHAFFDQDSATEAYGRVLLGLEQQGFA